MYIIHIHIYHIYPKKKPLVIWLDPKPGCDTPHPELLFLYHGGNKPQLHLTLPSEPFGSEEVEKGGWECLKPTKNITWNGGDHGTNIMLIVDIKRGTNIVLNIDGGLTKATIYYFQNSKLSQMCFSLLKKCSKTQQKHAKV